MSVDIQIRCCWSTVLNSALSGMLSGNKVPVLWQDAFCPVLFCSSSQEQVWSSGNTSEGTVLMVQEWGSELILRTHIKKPGYGGMHLQSQHWGLEVEAPWSLSGAFWLTNPLCSASHRPVDDSWKSPSDVELWSPYAQTHMCTQNDSSLSLIDCHVCFLFSRIVLPEQGVQW